MTADKIAAALHLDDIATALTYAAQCLDGVVSMDEEDEGSDGESAACQACVKLVNRALGKVEKVRAILAAGETKALIEFARAMCLISFEGGDASGVDIQEIAVKHGLLKAERFNAKRHTNVVNREYFSPGDAVYVFAGPLARPAPAKDEA